MTVDDLLEKNILTPLFITHRYIPKMNSLQTISCTDEEWNDIYIFAAADPPYFLQENDKFGPEPTRFMPDSFLKATGLRYEEYQTHNISLLRDILKLAEDSLINGKLNIKQDTVFQFCYKYGFPNDPLNDTSQFLLLEKGYIAGMYFKGDFVQEVENILYCYALWKALYIDDKSLLEKIRPKIRARDEMIDELEFFCRGSIEVSVTIRNDNPELIYHAKNMFELLKAQLAILVSKGSDYLEGGFIAYCPDCGQPFIKRRSNSMYCDRCKGFAGKKRRQRRKAGK